MHYYITLYLAGSPYKRQPSFQQLCTEGEAEEQGNDLLLVD